MLLFGMLLSALERNSPACSSPQAQDQIMDFLHKHCSGPYREQTYTKWLLLPQLLCN
uniref:Uncharacterized protein n=1 Tax=Picea sitchensis TaxID=3332 RepID=A0A6B9XR12_PICSI|nr:hypothetical protein Q903MT_gene5595 [Picea sitchensis]